MSDKDVVVHGETKRCCLCRKVKPLPEFHKDRNRSDGHGYYCRPCRAAYHKRKIYPKLKTDKKYQAYHREQQRRYSRRYPEKARAHVTARQVAASSACQQCGAADGPLHKHHPDYSRPKDVITLCVPCHERVHHAN